MGGNPPKVKEIPVPSRTSTQVMEAANEQRKALAEDASATNWLTGGLGVSSNKLKTGATALLGG